MAGLQAGAGKQLAFKAGLCPVQLLFVQEEPGESCFVGGTGLFAWGWLS